MPKYPHPDLMFWEVVGFETHKGLSFQVLATPLERNGETIILLVHPFQSRDGNWGATVSMNDGVFDIKPTDAYARRAAVEAFSVMGKKINNGNIRAVFPSDKV